jgi:hypothetical protein
MLQTQCPNLVSSTADILYRLCGAFSHMLVGILGEGVICL